MSEIKFIAFRKADQNRALMDPWTVVHFGAGMAAGLLGVGVVPAVGAAVVYELVEQALERSDAGQSLFKTSGPETLGNAVIDVAVFALAHQLGARYNKSGAAP